MVAANIRKNRGVLLFTLTVAVVGGIFIWRSFANPETAVPTSDLNGDGVVNVLDISRLLSLVGSDDAAADLNGDGQVTVADMSVLLSNYDRAEPLAEATSPPPAAPQEQPAPSQANQAPPAAASPPPAAAPAPAPVTPPAAKPANEIASEAECPGQSDPAATPSAMNDAVQCLTAIARRYHGLTTTSKQATLTESAAAKAADVANCGFSHTACGREAQHHIVAKGYNGGCWAENLARGQKTAKQVFSDWMNSSGHRAAILNPAHTELGVAQTMSDKGIVWVQHFGGCR